jgi:hypothetical protein
MMSPTNKIMKSYKSVLILVVKCEWCILLNDNIYTYMYVCMCVCVCVCVYIYICMYVCVCVCVCVCVYIYIYTQIYMGLLMNFHFLYLLKKLS